MARTETCLGTARRTLPVAAVIPDRDSPWVAEAVGRILRGDEVPEEIVVVDDGSRHPVPALEGVQVRRTSPNGRSAARNLGTSSTQAPFLWFVDTDVQVEPATLGRLYAAIRDEGLDGVMAVYADAPHRGYEGFRHTYQRFHILRTPAPRHLSAACLLIRRSCLKALGGFPDFPAMEDIALGVAGTQRGFRWRAIEDVQVRHLPRGRLQTLRRDHEERGMAAARLLQRGMVPLEHAASGRDLLAAALSMVFVLSLVALLLGRRIRLAILPFLLAGWIAAEWPWLRYATRLKGLPFAAASLGWLLCFRIAVITGTLRALVTRWPPSR